MDERDYLGDPSAMEAYHTLNNGHDFLKWQVVILLIESDMKTPFFCSASAINVRVTRPGIKEGQSDSFTTLHMYIGNWHIHPDPQRPATNPFIPPPAGPCLSPGTHHPEEHSGASRWSSLRQRLKSSAHRTQLLQSGLSRHVTQYQQMTSFSLSQLKSKLTHCLQTHRVDSTACNACEAAPTASTPKRLISPPRWGG